MDYASFKAYLATFLWKQNDADLIANMDNLILMAHAELSAKLTITRTKKTMLLSATSNDLDLPSDFRHMIAVNNPKARSGDMQVATLSDVYRQRAQQPNGLSLVYAVDQGPAGKVLRLSSNMSVGAPQDFIVTYRSNVPNYAVLDESWLEQDFLDLYTYAVLSHTAPFLREDERVALWKGLKDEAIAVCIDEDKHSVEFGGSPLHMRPHRQVP